jgi:hypothetical protein
VGGRRSGALGSSAVFLRRRCRRILANSTSFDETVRGNAFSAIAARRIRDSKFIPVDFHPVNVLGFAPAQIVAHVSVLLGTIELAA